jgi:isocitrate dehydrogenase kinase/phosphatase
MEMKCNIINVFWWALKERFMSVIPATQETEIGESWFKANLGKKLARPHLKKQTGHGGTQLQSQL